MLITKSLDSICHHTVDPLTHATQLSPFSSDNRYSILCIYVFAVFLYFNYFNFHNWVNSYCDLISPPDLFYLM